MNVCSYMIINNYLLIVKDIEKELRGLLEAAAILLIDTIFVGLKARRFHSHH